VKNRSYTPKDVDFDTFNRPATPSHVAELRPDTDVSDTDVTGMV
jgi:hypothetical protein